MRLKLTCDVCRGGLNVHIGTYSVDQMAQMAADAFDHYEGPGNVECHLSIGVAEPDTAEDYAREDTDR